MNNVRQFKNLITKTLQQSTGKGRTADQVAEAIVTKIETAMELISEMGGLDIPVVGSVSQAPPQDFQAQVNQSSDPVDISTRLRQAGEEPPKGLVEKYTTEQLSEFAKNQMASSLWVKPPEFDKPFEIKKTVEAAPGDIGYVRISYSEPGASSGPTVSICTTDQTLDADALTESIISQANSVYTKNKRVLTPRMPALSGSPGDLRNAIGEEAPDNAANVNTWTERTSQPSASQTWKGLRQQE